VCIEAAAAGYNLRKFRIIDVQRCGPFRLRPPRMMAGMTRPLTSLPHDTRGTAIIEMALLLPLFLMLLLGILIYGQYFLLAHSVQQAANDGARAAITEYVADQHAAQRRALHLDGKLDT
jgi:Flp pilus assembly protein TadG